ncbi:MAG TPA: Asp-tRNA(Asn)/Glu-tRNA(Gln) amidotransferase subunit GatB [Chitinophagaceae bacterium]|nr:Asp-tRNA(Asn)/Glu-tRNA(Gln) amidotransferase subunit GatB [Chitinophagaceae bacterium]
MTDYNKYETIVGLEVHAQLQTASKLFCGDSIAFGAAPNTHISPVTLAHPGTLPVMNRKAIELAVKMGLACHCTIAKENWFARKNYFYPDLPKGYQVTQHTTPICEAGYVEIANSDGTTKKTRLNRIHLEEDAGKSIHDADDDYTLVDYNRAGTPLIEMVTEPDIRSGDEAYAYLTVVRRLVRYLGICDGNMEEGSMRCDANISVRLKGESRLGTRVEIKNLNSIRNVKRAIEAESKRLIDMLEAGKTIIQQTRSFDANTGTSFATREKEDADDYRYFPEPDLAPFSLSDSFIEKIRETIPALQEERIKRYTGEYQLSAYDAGLLTEEREMSDYFESVISHTTNYKAAANWILGPVKNWLNENNTDITGFPLSAPKLASLIAMVESGELSFTVAASRLFPLMLRDRQADPAHLASTHNLLQQSDGSAIGPIIDQVLLKFADKVTEYKKGKKGLLALFVGEVMKQSKGKADPKITNELLLEKLKA